MILSLIKLIKKVGSFFPIKGLKRFKKGGRWGRRK
jgi:hypothetical protein